MEMWAWIDIRLIGDRVFGTNFTHGYGVHGTVTITLNGTYLPSTQLECQLIGAGIEFGTVSFPDGTSYTVQHNNPSCVGYPPQLHPPTPTSSYWISEEMHNTSQFLVSAVNNGAQYWGLIGSELGYTELRTPPGGDLGLYIVDEGPGVMGQYYPGSRTIGLGWFRFQSWHDRFDKWAYAAAHEFGHAIGFDHAGSTDSIMPWDSAGQEGLLPRTADKCGSVKMFPINIQAG